VPLEGYPRTAFGWPVVPEGLQEVLVGLHMRYGAALPPIYITENGCAYDDVVDADGEVTTRSASHTSTPTCGPSPRRRGTGSTSAATTPGR
jgi:hypothetical protein